MNADKLTITDEDSIPTGLFQNVSNTFYDLRNARNLGQAIAEISNNGYDDNYCVIKTENQSLAFVAK